jgi:antitoxin YefM
MAEYTSIVPLSQAKASLSRLVRRVKEEHGTYAITNRGKPEGVLLSVEEFESMVETLDILSDKDLMAALRRGAADEKAGRLHSHAKVFPKR